MGTSLREGANVRLASEILYEQLARQEAEESLAGYARYVLGVSPARHHELICQEIDDLLADEYDELIINSPPGSAKSTYTSHALGSYFLGRNPEGNVIIATHTADLSERWSAKIQNTLCTAEHELVFPDSKLSKASTAKSRWATTKGGELLAAGVGGSILGFRADLGIIDDPISGFEQAQSTTQLQKVQGWYETDFITRLKPNAKVVLICQRLSANDLAGYLIARNQENPTKRQRILILKMECEVGDCIPSESDQRLISKDGTERQPGDRLWPEWFTPQMVADAKRDDFKWRTLYQQSPPSETGSWVPNENLHIVPDLPPGHELWPRYMATDIALSVNTGDYTARMVAAVSPNMDLYIIFAHRTRDSIDEIADDAIALCEHHAPNEYLIDDDNASKVFVQLLARLCREKRRYVPFKALPIRGQDKETRAAPIRGWFRRNKVYFLRGAWNEWVIREILSFPNAMGQGVDDGIDCLSLFGRRLASLAAGRSQDKQEDLTPKPSEYTLDNLFADRERALGHARRI